MALPAYIAFVTDYTAVTATDEKDASHKADLLLIDYFAPTLSEEDFTEEEFEKAKSDPEIAAKIVKFIFDVGLVEDYDLAYGILPLRNA